MLTFAEAPKPQPGVKTVKNLLVTVIEPVGKTMYIWGGGWNAEDTGSGEGSTHIGLMPEWEPFTKQQDADYDFHNFEYQINKGLDCSGFVGWTLYNVFNTENGKVGFVMPSTKMAREFANRGFGSFKDKSEVTDYKAGDIMSGQGMCGFALASAKMEALYLCIARLKVCKLTERRLLMATRIAWR